MMRLLVVIAIFISLATFTVNAQKEDHSHDDVKPKGEQEEHKDHEGEEGHEDHKEHGEHEGHKDDEHKSDSDSDHEESHDHDESGEHEESTQVGPDKGILEVSESDGFKLSPEAEKNFEILRIKVSSASFEVPKNALVTAVAEINLFRYRGGFYKRVDYAEINRSQEKVFVRSSDIKPGDEIVVHGLGFLRIAEIAAFGGAPEGHSH